MSYDRETTIGYLLRTALKTQGIRQLQLAEYLSIASSSVSRWVNDKEIPRTEYLVRIDHFLGTNLVQFTDPYQTADPVCEVFVATPMASVPTNTLKRNREWTTTLVEKLQGIVGRVYWAGRNIDLPEDFDVPDIGTEENLRALGTAKAFVLVYFDPVAPTWSGSMIELGLALGLKIPVTLFVSQTTPLPYMLEGFEGVAERTGFLPRVRIYRLQTPEEAVLYIEKNGKDIFF